MSDEPTIHTSDTASPEWAEIRTLRAELTESTRIATELLRQIAANTAPHKPIRAAVASSRF